MTDQNIEIIRASTSEHAEQLLYLIRRLADFEKLAPPTEEAKQRFMMDGFQTSPPRFRAILAGIEGQEPSGYAIYFDTYSTFLCRPTLFLEDIFVLPEARQTGIGKALMIFLASEARENGYGRMEWTCLDWNTNAQAFYDRVGAQHLKEWFFYRMDSAAIERFIAS